MTVEIRPVPTNLMAWPKHQDMVNGYKTMIYWMWSNTHISNAGVMIFPIAESGAATSNPQAVVQGMLNEFHRRKIILRDLDTGEIFINDWFRYHRFPKNRLHALRNDIAKIRSPQLRIAVEDAASDILRKYDSRSPTLVETSSTKTMGVLCGVEYWSQDEHKNLLDLIERFSVEQVQEAADQVREERNDGKAFLSGVLSKLVLRKKQDSSSQALAQYQARKSIEDETALQLAKTDKENLEKGRKILNQRYRISC